MWCVTSTCLCVWALCDVYSHGPRSCLYNVIYIISMNTFSLLVLFLLSWYHCFLWCHRSNLCIVYRLFHRSLITFYIPQDPPEHFCTVIDHPWLCVHASTMSSSVHYCTCNPASDYVFMCCAQSIWLLVTLFRCCGYVPFDPPVIKFIVIGISLVFTQGYLIIWCTKQCTWINLQVDTFWISKSKLASQISLCMLTAALDCHHTG